jgi:hypothetical protein
MAKKTKRPRSTGKLSLLDDFLAGEGKLEEFEAVAIQGSVGLANRRGDEGPEYISGAAGPMDENQRESDWAPPRSDRQQCHIGYLAASSEDCRTFAETGACLITSI